VVSAISSKPKSTVGERKKTALEPQKGLFHFPERTLPISREGEEAGATYQVRWL